MFKDWSKLLATDCKVIGIKDKYVYPIFRNASTSLFRSQESVLVNEQIGLCEDIEIFIRDPMARFVSGLNEYSRSHKLEIMEAWQRVQDETLIDRHFAPQCMWLLHLYKYHRGTVTLRPFDSVKKFTNIHTKMFPGQKTMVPTIPRLVDVDYKLVELIGTQVKLSSIVEEFKNVLS
tara:strand:- start:278 stop:805 length:528 start_codon:yes stop_codon:yes gene_type:complete